MEAPAKPIALGEHGRGIENMFKLAGDTEQAAALKATMVMDFEMLLAKDALDRVSMCDPNKTYHMLTRKELAALAPNFDWEAYFKGVGAPAFDSLNVAYPDGAKQLSADLPSQSIDAWKAYFSYHVLRATAS